jgi:hypothetical protein
MPKDAKYATASEPTRPAEPVIMATLKMSPPAKRLSSEICV